MKKNLRILLSVFGTGMVLSGPVLSADRLMPEAVPAAVSHVAPQWQPWMSTDVASAWSLGYTGQGTKITVVDDFSSANRLWGSLRGNPEWLRHGEWTAREAALIAPSANVGTVDFTSAPSALSLQKSGLNVINASYGLYGALLPSAVSFASFRLGGIHDSIVSSASSGAAVVAKAAGNYGVAVDGVFNGKSDYLNLALKGAQSAIFVGALSPNKININGTGKSLLASYSNLAGTDPTIQKQFLVVTVDSNKTGLSGTSFAAPIVSGYAAILGSKFNNASATQITNQLLSTARTDTIYAYNPAQHGRGEASLARALAPVSIK